MKEKRNEGANNGMNRRDFWPDRDNYHHGLNNVGNNNISGATNKKGYEGFWSGSDNNSNHRHDPNRDIPGGNQPIKTGNEQGIMEALKAFITTVSPFIG